MQDEMKNILILYAEGHSINNIAKVVGHSPTLVMNKLREAGYDTGYDRIRKIKMNKLLKLLKPYLEKAKEGKYVPFMWKSFASELGKSTITTRKWVKQMVKEGMLAEKEYRLLDRLKYMEWRKGDKK